MSDKFKKIVNFPHKIFGAATKKIGKTKPESTGGKVARVAGMGMTGMFQFLLWATKYVALDNHVLRAGEKALARMKVGKNKDGQEKKVSKFMKQYPDLSAHLLYYLMFFMVAGGIKAGPEIHDTITEYKIERDAEIAKKGTYAAYLDNMRPITPLLIADLIAKEGVRVDPETGLHRVYDDADGHFLKPGEKPKGNATIGFGCTVLKDGTKVNSYTPPITTEEAYELARWHIEEGETFFLLYCYDTGVEGIDISSTNHALGLGSVFYNAASLLVEDSNDKNHKERFTELRKLYKEYGYTMPDSLVVEKFNEYPVKKMCSFGKAWIEEHDEEKMADKLGQFAKQGRGLYWRRWLEAGLITGEISAEMLLDCPIKGMYEFYCYMGKKKNAFFSGEANGRHVNYETFEVFRQWLKNPVNKNGQSLSGWKKVSDYLPVDVANVCRSGMCKVGNKDVKLPTYDFETMQDIESVLVETYVIGYNELYAEAIGFYRSGNYKVAAQKYESMVAKYPDNALLRNDLSATYNMLGRYNDAIKQAKDVLHRIGDASQYAAAQYNAGVAYEALGNLQKALANYKLSLANGNKKVQKHISRVTEQMKKPENKRVAFMMSAERLRSNMNEMQEKQQPVPQQIYGGKLV